MSSLTTSEMRIFMILFALANCLTFAQQPGGTGTTAPPIVGGAPYIEAWVDPCTGSNITGTVGCPDQPFLTLNAAINAVSLAGASAATPGIVHANPGIYQGVPVIMTDFVNVQGAGAKRTIIRGIGQPNYPFLFWPEGGESCTCGVRRPGEVLVDCTFLTDNTYEEMIDGFTFQRGDMQVYAETEFGPIRARVSNCVFDMLDAEDGPGPYFGLIMVHVYNLTAGGIYYDIPMNVLNNTFIQGWLFSEDNVITSRPDAVAITDVSDPACWATPDPDISLRGLGNPSIQNNLIRYACEQRRTSLLGIDNSDVTVAVGTSPGPTNGFDPGTVGGFDLTGRFCSRILGAPPTPRLNPQPATGGVDPAFVGEFLSNSLGYAFNFSRDWRLLPSSAFVDVGSAPVGGTLVAANGTTYTDAGFPEQSFDFDGEHYGNLRIQGAFPDIGFDETDVLVSAGGYFNDTRSQIPGCSCYHPFGTSSKLFIFPGPGNYDLFNTIACKPFIPPAGTPGICVAGSPWAFSTQFGTLVPPVVVGGFPPTNAFQYIQFPPIFPFCIVSSVVFTGRSIPNQVNYTPPCANTLHRVAFDRPPPSATPACVYLNEQVVYRNANGTTPLLSNLQSGYGDR
ncbi:MAG: hypothetical protein QNK37_25645 [Acidobacteriota bacterium]|nr:hypothetical protein [Acidobacteriota bacterium]